MKGALWHAVPTVLLVLWLTGVPGAAQAPSTDAPERDAQTMAILTLRSG